MLDAYNRMESHAAATLKIVKQTIRDGDTATAAVQLDLLDRMLGEARPESADLRKQLAGGGKGTRRGKADRPRPLVDEKAITASLGLGKGGIDNGFGCGTP